MRLNICSVFLLLIGCVCLQRVGCRLPDFTPVSPRLQVDVSDVLTSLQKNRLGRLPGLCRRLKRRRVTILCNREKFCWPTLSQKTRPVHVCLCPRGSMCSHFFVQSL
ncbi:uncharacterized protein si:ch211-191i18.4 [Etheostoma cragini]|uniref:uncharacterized protein si:ch211-191i18.4 n=1 Tax=Etheostoma cragini TaxID=417921 RepID=UPI00155E8FC8|nr:uncharacterized protein si:ch211-191i18.4 [Etheostoma cragini]